MAKNSYPKGSVGNSYTSDEYESMMENGTWKGGFVKTEEGKYEYYRNHLYEGASGCGCGSDDELGGSGSDAGSGSNVKPLNGSGSVGSCCWSSEISSVNDLGNDCVVPPLFEPIWATIVLFHRCCGCASDKDTWAFFARSRDLFAQFGNSFLKIWVV